MAAFGAGAFGGDWSVPPDGYIFEATAACREDAARAAMAARPGDARYDVCADQMAIFARGLEEARRSDKLLLVTFGATWCAWCTSLQKQLPSNELLGHTAQAFDFGRGLHHVEIGISTTSKGAKDEIPSGNAVLRLVLARVPGVELRAIPFIAVIDPANRDRVVARNIDDLALTGQGRFDPVRLRDVLHRAHVFVRTGSSPPAVEPGWIMRKLTRWWYG